MTRTPFYKGLKLENTTFELEELVDDSGAHGEVWSCRDISWPGRKAQAIKLVYTDFEKRSSDRRFLEQKNRFENELSVLGEIQNRHIVTPHAKVEGLINDPAVSSTTSSGIIFHGLVMELANFGNLEKISRTAMFSGVGLTEKFEILHRLSKAVEFVHSANIIHNDLKPANVLAFKQGAELIPKIADFGMSFRKSDAPTMGGTPLYMAPEILLSTGHGLEKSDIFSLGVMFVEFISGKHPLRHLFPGGSNSRDAIHNWYKTHHFINDNTFQEILGRVDVAEFSDLVREMCDSNFASRPTIANVVQRTKHILDDLRRNESTFGEDKIPNITSKFRWHSAVHEALGQFTQFYLIHGSRPLDDVRWIVDNLETQKIHGYCLSRFSGQTDYILKTYLSNADSEKVKECLHQYQRSRFGHFTPFLPTISKVSEGILRKPQSKDEIRRKIEDLVSLQEDANRSRSAIKELKSSKLITGEFNMAVTQRGRSDLIDIVLLLQTASIGKGEADSFATALLTKLGGLVVDPEIHVEIHEGSDAHFLISFSLRKFFDYTRIFDQIEKYCSEYKDNFVRNFRTHFGIDRVPVRLSHDGNMIFAVWKIKQRTSQSTV